MLVSMCPSLPCSGVYVLFTVLHLGRFATTWVPHLPALKGASGHQAVVY